MKKFLIQIQPGPDTRWLFDDETIAHTIARDVGTIIRNASMGPEPSVTVIQEECPCEICTPNNQ